MIKREEIQSLLQLNFSILDFLEDWVRVLDSNGNIIYMNEAMRENNKSLVNSNCKSLEDSSLSCVIVPDIIPRSTVVVEEKFINGRYYNVKSSPLFDKENKLRGSIEVYRDITSETKMKIDLFNANRKMVDDIRFTRKIQQNILPRNGIYNNIELEGFYMPCESLSGDIYDIVRITPTKTAFYIADVMGHGGVTASIMTMFVKQTMNAIFDKYKDKSPSQVLSILKEKFYGLKSNTSQYFTLWLGIFDSKTKTLSFSNAGHNSIPILYDGNIRKLYVKGRMISNVFEEDKFEEYSEHIKDNDQILFYTDGVIESQNYQKEFYGMERLENKFKKDQNLNNIVENIKSFAWGEQKDDIAVVILKYKE